MQCLEAQAILSAAHDGDVVAESDIIAATEHCRDCEDCAPFEAGLRWLDVMPTPSAPAEVIDRTLGIVAGIAADRTEAARVEAEQAAAEREAAESQDGAPELFAVPEAVAPARFPWLSDQVKWAGIGAIATIAAAGLIAFVVLGSGAGANTAGTNSPHGGAASDSNAVVGVGTQTLGGAPAATAPAPANPAPATAPDYVAYKNLVYSPGALLADSSSATPTIGTVTTAFASSGTPSRATVYASPVKDGSIVVQGPDGLRLYSPVVRLLSSVRYQLEAGDAIARFGEWPTLPTRFTAPTAADGSPTFAAAGVDSLGVNVFAATGQPVTSGFALAPGTSASDPAGGNPNWTWWQPVAAQ